MSEQGKPSEKRRQMIKTIGGVGGGVLLASHWQRPVVDSVILPAHAQATGFSGSATFGTGAVVLVDAGPRILELLVPTAHAIPIGGIVPERFSVCVTVISNVATIDVSLCASGSDAVHSQSGVDVSGAITNVVVPFSSGSDVFGTVSVSGQIQAGGLSYEFAGSLTHAGGSDGFTASDGGDCSPVFCCFLAGTPVWMADGSYKAIEDIQLGDLVTSHDFATGRQLASPVTRLHRGASDGFFNIDGLRVTGRHPFAVGHELWRPAEELRPGDVVQGAYGPKPVNGIRIDRRTTDVFNLRVAGTHNYYVASSGQEYLVHNK